MKDQEKPKTETKENDSSYEEAKRLFAGIDDPPPMYWPTPLKKRKKAE
jgi:hypothetical protein